MQSLASTDREEVWRNTSTSHMLSEHQVEIQQSWKKGRRREQRILMFLNAFQYGQGVKTENPCVMRWENAGRSPAQGARGKSPAWQSKGSLFLCKKKKKKKKEQGNLGARKVVSFHGALQHWNNTTERQSNTQHKQHASRGLGNMQLRLKGWLVSLTLPEMERFSAFFSCHLEILIFLI